VARDEVRVRAQRHAALGEPARLAIVDELIVSDRAPVELGRRTGLGSNLLAHHLDVLERVGLIERNRSSGDGRRRYVHLRSGALDGLAPGRPVVVGPALFVCSANSARSQLAAVLWEAVARQPATSAGTRPADRVHRGAVRAARRAGFDLTRAVPTALADVTARPDLVVTVCDRAHEELARDDDRLHWSVADPVADGSAAAFDRALADLRGRIETLVGSAR
jgi:protein-tyrosine-phosphatase